VRELSLEHLDIFTLAERLHRKFLSVIQIGLDRHRVHDVNSVRALILLNLKDDEMSVSELMYSGCYLGSNVSYNLKKLTEAGYLEQVRGLHDRRVVMVRNTPKGAELCQVLLDIIMREFPDLQGNYSKKEELTVCHRTLRGLEQSCSRMIEGHGLGASALLAA
jgi:DNA-binding MarR family transcriptional regulator